MLVVLYCNTKTDMRKKTTVTTKFGRFKSDRLLRVENITCRLTTRKGGNLPLKAARHDASVNLKSFGPRDTVDSICLVLYAAPPYSAGTVVIVFTEGG